MYFTDRDSSLLKDDLISPQLISVMRWDKLCKKSLLNQFIQSYGDLNLSMFEDWYFMQFMLLFIKKCKVCNKVNSYYYYVNQDSVMHTVKSLDYYKEMVDKFKKADSVLSNYSNKKVSLVSHRAYPLAFHCINQYVERLNKKDACLAVKEVLKNADFQASLRVVTYKQYNKCKLSAIGYLKFKLLNIIYKLKLSKIVYCLCKRKQKRKSIEFGS